MIISLKYSVLTFKFLTEGVGTLLIIMTPAKVVNMAQVKG